MNKYCSELCRNFLMTLSRNIKYLYLIKWCNQCENWSLVVSGRWLVVGGDWLVVSGHITNKSMDKGQW